jgi:hypothetical protein
MRVALISGGVVVNIILADVAFAQMLGYDAAIDVTGQDVAIGDNYANGVFTRP